MIPRPPSGRRTQRERREATVGKLIEATIAAIADVGYARTSVQEICGRAELSHGGMFRHFDTRLDLIVATAVEVARRQIDSFTDRFAQLAPHEATLADMLPRLRELSREPINAVWHEMLVAARTDHDMRVRLRPIVDSYREELYTVAMKVPGVNVFGQDIRDVVLFSVLYLFDGEALIHPFVLDDTHEQRRLALVEGWLKD